MDLSLVILRVIHILSGVFWAGATFFLTGVLQPAVDDGGPEAGRFMQRLTSQRRFRIFMALGPALTVLSGLVLYGRVSAGFQRVWMTTGPGLVLTVGSLATILTVVVFAAVQRPVLERLQALGSALQTSRAQPSPAQAAEMQGLQGRMRGSALWVAVLLIVAVVAMASARYI